MKFSELQDKVASLSLETKNRYSAKSFGDFTEIEVKLVDNYSFDAYQITEGMIGSFIESPEIDTIPKRDRLALQKLAYKYSRTPLDKRRDEPKFRVRMMIRGDNSYLNLLKENIDGQNAGSLLIGGCLDAPGAQTIFAESEYKKIQQAIPQWLPKFDKNDPHFEFVDDEND